MATWRHPQKTQGIEIVDVGGALPFFAYVDGALLRKKDGTGRRFKTEKAALRAALSFR